MKSCWFDRKGWTCLNLACLAAFIFLLHWNTISLPLIRDEGEYAYSAWLLGQGSVPYRDAFMQKPPMIIYSYFLAQWLDPATGLGARYLMLAFQFCSCLLLGAIARLEIGSHAAGPAMWLLGPMLLMPRLNQFAANTEQFLVLPLLALWLLYARRRGEAPAKTWFWAGLVSAAILFYKYSVLPMGLFLFAVWAIETWQKLSQSVSGNSRRNRSREGERPRGPKRLRKGEEIWARGDARPPGPDRPTNGALGYHTLTSAATFQTGAKTKQSLVRLCAAGLGLLSGVLLIMGFFLCRDGGASWYECTVVYNRFYAMSHQFQWNEFVSEMGFLARHWWFLVLLTLSFFIPPPKRWWFFLGLIAAALLSTTGSGYGHYYLPLMPLWAMVAAGGVAVCADRITQRLKCHTAWATGSLTLLGIILTLWPSRDLLTMSRTELERVKYGEEPFSESVLAAKKVTDYTSPEDRILVAGSEPQILYYAKRISYTRFVIFYPLTLPTPLAAQYQRQLMQEIKSNPPKLVVLVEYPYSWLLDNTSSQQIIKELNDLLKNYAFMGAARRTAAGVTWSAPGSFDPNKELSLLVFVRRESPQ